MLFCITLLCKNSQSPHSYKYDKLRERIAHQTYTIQCDNPPYNIVNVQGLIDDVIIDIDSFNTDTSQIGEDEVESKYNKQYIFNLGGDTVMNLEGNVYNQSGKLGIGHISGGKIQDNVVIAGEYNEAKQQNLAQAAANIQTLLAQLETTYNISSQKGKIAIADKVVEEIDTNTKLIATKRILSALKSGSIEALSSLLNHPAANFVIGALQDWKNNE